MRSALTLVLTIIATSLAQAGDTRPPSARSGDDPGQPWQLQLSTEKKSYLVRPDGREWTEVPHSDSPKGLSPDGRRIASVRNMEGQGGLFDAEVFAANADGANAVRLTDNDTQDGSPLWWPDSDRLIFLSDRDGLYQVYAIDPNGSNLEQLTRVPAGVEQLKLAPGGQFSYLAQRTRQGKVWHMDLMRSDGKTSRAVVRNKLLYNDYAWSPDDKSLAYGKIGALVFHDLPTGKEKRIDLASIDPRMKDYAVFNIAWRPDSKAIACQIKFFGGREQGGPKMFGDEEIFIIPEGEKPTWFTPQANPTRFDWVRQARTPTQGAVRIDSNSD